MIGVVSSGALFKTAVVLWTHHDTSTLRQRRFEGCRVSWLSIAHLHIGASAFLGQSSPTRTTTGPISHHPSELPLPHLGTHCQISGPDRQLAVGGSRLSLDSMPHVWGTVRAMPNYETRQGAPASAKYEYSMYIQMHNGCRGEGGGGVLGASGRKSAC